MKEITLKLSYYILLWGIKDLFKQKYELKRDYFNSYKSKHIAVIQRFSYQKEAIVAEFVLKKIRDQKKQKDKAKSACGCSFLIVQ